MYNFITQLASKLRSFTASVATGYTDALGTARTRAFDAAPGVAIDPGADSARNNARGNSKASRKGGKSASAAATAAPGAIRTLTLDDGTELPEEEARLADYFRAGADLPTPSLNALDTRSPSYLDIIAYLVDTGRTPAASHDVQEAFVAIHQRVPGPAELRAMIARVAEFGLLDSSAL